MTMMTSSPKGDFGSSQFVRHPTSLVLPTDPVEGPDQHGLPISQSPLGFNHVSSLDVP